MERTRLIAGILLVLLIATGLIYVVVTQAGEVDQPTSAVEPTASAEAPSPEPDANPEPSPEAEEEPEPVAVPTPDTTGRDFDHIFREIVAFRDWLFANPDPELLRLIYRPDCECYEEVEAALTYLEGESLRLDDDGTLIHELEVAESFESLVRLHVVLERSPQVVVNSDGDVIETTEGSSPTRYSVTLVRDGDIWRVRTIRGV